ncbi:hypothetical protein SORBI_3004G230700 [Sorghum bicolor]|uniref:Ubiquitin-like protease family profile domain-containing protein n=2 Tax=Sorghum bicolor TaxID=4558 RepID=A0A1Z5RNQ8_SORBI|nr:hypothetical protein SORBI_3004G230700 [Sorghum bicolor]
MLDGVKSFNQGKKAGQRSCGTLGGCMFYLAVMYLDHVDFSHRRIPDSFPRIEVWKLNMIRDYSDLDLKSPSIYGMRPLLDFEKTCYHKALCSQSVPVVDDSDDVQFLKKLEEACGCDVPDDLKAIVLSVIEDHCKSCLSPISIDVVSLGTLPDEFKKLFNKLMQHVYSLKSKSRDLVLKVLKVFADYESGLADREVCASRLSPRVAEHGTGIHKTNLDEPCAIYEDGAHSFPKVPNVAVASQVGAKLAVDVDPAGSSLKRSSPCTSKHVRFGLDVPKGIFHDVARASDGANHSKSVPAITNVDVIRVGTESDAEVELFSSPNHYVGPTIVMQTIPDSDDDSARITPKLSKIVSSASQLNHLSKVGSSVVVPVNISSPEVTIVGSRSLSQKLKSMGKKSEDVYNSNVNKSIPGLKSSHQSLSKTLGYACSTPIEGAGGSSRSDFKIRDSSTGGKVPIHGPRRLVVPSRKIRDEFEIERSKFKISKSQILNYKAICSLAASRDSGVDAILFGSVRCTFWALGESLKPGGMVNNFVMAAFCYYLFNQASGHPDLSKCHYFFSNIADHLLKDADVASEEILNRALTRSSKNRPLYCSDLLFFPCFHDEHWFVFVVDIKDRSFVFLDSYYALHDEYQADVRDRMIPNFKHWWKRCGLVDMGFNNYKLHYPYVPRQSATNYTDSGVYVMMFLEHWKSPRNSLFTLFKESDIPNLRIKFANDLLLSPKNSGRKDLVTNFEFADNEES